MGRLNPGFGFSRETSVLPTRRKTIRLSIRNLRPRFIIFFKEKVCDRLSIESGIIIGVLNTEIWPESERFSDEGFGLVPTKWKGKCADSFPCNKNLIGATTFISSEIADDSPRDLVDHGTHIASTAAGNIIHGANFFDIAAGTARGSVPSARIAVYQVCNEGGYPNSDILAAFDNAIKDGVDIVSISIWVNLSSDFIVDTIAIGAFHALKKGILTVHSLEKNCSTNPNDLSSL